MTTKRKGKPARRRKPAAARFANMGKAGAQPIVDRAKLLELGIKPRRGQLTDDAVIGALGTVPLKLTKAEDRILSEPVQLENVEVRTDGSIFLSHPAYTRWFNRAFGRLGWAIVPAAKPRRERGDVLCDYLLYIHGKPVAFATGRMEIDVTPRGNSYGDALEATVASALRRCAKRLGVGLELWDRKFIDSFLEQRCVCVFRKNERLPQYRLVASQPFVDELGPAAGGRMQGQGRPPAAGHDGRGDEKISPKQVGRLVGICRRCGRTDDSVKGWLKRRYGLTSRRDIKRRDYDEICAAVESPRPLPVREPGEDG